MRECVWAHTPERTHQPERAPVYMRIRMTRAYTYIRVRTHICLYTHICERLHTWYVYVHMCAHLYTRACVPVFVHVLVCSCSLRKTYDYLLIISRNLCVMQDIGENNPLHNRTMHISGALKQDFDVAKQDSHEKSYWKSFGIFCKYSWQKSKLVL